MIALSWFDVGLFPSGISPLATAGLISFRL